MKNDSLCVMGLFRSGTNFLRGLIEVNYHCRVEYDTYGWKHGFFPVFSEQSRISYRNIPVIVVTKDPFHHMVSLFNYFTTNPRNVVESGSGSFAAFLRKPLVIRNGSDVQSIEYYFPNPVEYWNSMNWNLNSLVRNRPDAVHMKYEALVADPSSMAGSIACRFSFEARDQTFKLIDRHMNNLANQQHDPEKFQSRKPFDKGSVLNREYMASYATEDQEFVRSCLSGVLLERLGYGAC